MSTRKWPDIEGLHVVVRDHAKHGRPLGLIRYKAKIKLDGTNAAVRLRGGEVVGFQSRTQDVSPESDNAGFARWASTVPWPRLGVPQQGVVVIHGEWAGPGVQKGTACQQIPGKRFFVFAVEVCSDEVDPDTGDWTLRELITDPGEIRDLLGDFHPEVLILPWHPIDLDPVNLMDEASVQAFADKVNAEVLAVEAKDPYIAATFGVEGVGEGLVFYPEGSTSRERWRRLAFKAKGEKHRVKAAKVAAEVAPEVLASVSAFVAAFVTEPRCQQGLTVTGAERGDMRKLGPFLQWIGKDVEKESRTELEASGLTWKAASAAVTAAAKTWFLGV